MTDLDQRVADAIAAHVDTDELIARGKAVSESGVHNPSSVPYVEPKPLVFADTQELDRKHRANMKSTFRRQ